LQACGTASRRFRLRIVRPVKMGLIGTTENLQHPISLRRPVHDIICYKKIVYSGILRLWVR